MKVEPLNQMNMHAILGANGGNGWKNSSAKWAEILSEHDANLRHVLVAMEEGSAIAYGSILWRSGYSIFAAQRIPELHDLVTAETHRGRGIATLLVGKLEAHAAAAGYKRIGLGVGLYGDYGPAQRLYSSIGYTLDGRGATYQNEYPAPGTLVRLDDDLLLWMTKTLA